MRSVSRPSLRVLLAPNAFKESASARNAAAAMARGVVLAEPEARVQSVPLADGGDGTADVLASMLGADTRRVQVQTSDALRRPLTTEYILSGDSDVAVIESALSIGIARINRKERDILQSSTFGVGQVLKSVLMHADTAPSKIIVCVGGSATNDGGAGLAHALGYEFLDSSGDRFTPTGGNLNALCRIVPPDDSDEVMRRLQRTQVLVAVDVENPLLGPSGATYVFGPQKGAQPHHLPILERGITKLSEVWKSNSFFRRDIAQMPKSGAGGGLAAGLVAFCFAELKSGFHLISDMLVFEDAIKNCDIVITGEGALDATSALGKVPSCVAQLAQQYNKPCIVLAGSVPTDHKQLQQCYASGMSAVFSICSSPLTLEESKKSVESLLESSSLNAIRLFQASYSQK